MFYGNLQVTERATSWSNRGRLSPHRLLIYCQQTSYELKHTPSCHCWQHYCHCWQQQLSIEFIEAEIESLRNITRNDRVRKSGLRSGTSVDFPVACWPAGCQPISGHDLRSILEVCVTPGTFPAVVGCTRVGRTQIPYAKQGTNKRKWLPTKFCVEFSKAYNCIHKLTWNQLGHVKEWSFGMSLSYLW